MCACAGTCAYGVCVCNARKKSERALHNCTMHLSTGALQLNSLRLDTALISWQAWATKQCCNCVHLQVVERLAHVAISREDDGLQAVLGGSEALLGNHL